jgi:hypothetical protein
MLDKLILNNSWSIKDDCLYCFNIHTRPILRYESNSDSYLINFDIGYYTEIKKIITHLHKLDKPFYFVKNFSKPDRRLLLLNKRGEEIVKEDILNAVKTYAMNPKIHDTFSKHDVDFFQILTDYIKIHNALDLFRELYPKIEKDLVKSTRYAYPGGNIFHQNTSRVPVIDREDIRNEIASLERIISLNMLL